MRSKIVLTALLVVMLLAGLATPMAVAQRPEDEEAAERAQAALEEALDGPAATGEPRPAATMPGTVLYFWDFEGDNGGFVGTLDWVWGTYAWNGATCDSSNYPPPNAYSGTDMWGTRLNTCYQNLGNNAGYDTCVNGNPADDSILSFAIDLTGISTAVELSWWEWFDLFMPWDWAEVYANGQVVFQHCGGSFVQPTAWEQQVVDLTPYAGGPVTIEFHMLASTVVNHAGWFIDDVMITAELPIIVVEPLALEAELCPDEMMTLELSICNVGDADLEWEMQEQPEDIPWLSEDPITGTVAPDDCQIVDVTFDSTMMDPDDYLADLLILSNDPDTPQVVVPVTMVVLAPVEGVDFVWEPEIGVVDEPITFTALEPVGTAPFTFTWSFGDGGTGTGITTTHTYTAADVYTVTLWVENLCGSVTAEHLVTVGTGVIEMEIYLPVLLKNF